MGALPPLGAGPGEMRDAPRCPSRRTHRGHQHRGGLRHGRLLRARSTTRPRPGRRRHAHHRSWATCIASATSACPSPGSSAWSPPPQRASSPHWPAGLASVTAGAALALLVGWLLLYLRVSAPINRALTAAADKHETPANARALQHDRDRVIVPRAVLQGLAVAALCVSLLGSTASQCHA